MAKSGGSRGRPSGGRRPLSPKRASGKPVAQPNRPKKSKPAPSVEPPAPPITGPFTLGVIPGATPGKWIDLWKERLPLAPLHLQTISAAQQLAELLGEELDAAIVRLPIDDRHLSVIPLYDEIAVVVTSAQSHLTAADELDLVDLAGEVRIVPEDDVLALAVPGTVAPRFAPPADTEQAIATVAAGVGVVIVPMSLARLHQRKDATYRSLRDAPPSRVALAWRADHTTPAVEAFIGIVRGRTANSSR